MRKSFPRLVVALAIGLGFFAHGMPPGNATHQIQVNIGDASVVEGNGNCGTSNMVFPVTLTSAPDHYGAVVVTYATADGSATSAGACPPRDYDAVSSTTLTFGPTETSKTITVLVRRGNTLEPNESFFVDSSARATRPSRMVAGRGDPERRCASSVNQRRLAG